MTNEIEKQFFDTFGIEAYYKYLLIDKTTKWHNEKLMDKTQFIDFVSTSKDYLLLKVIKYYPQITDSVLLKLICILTIFFKEVVLISSINKEDLKEQVLSIFIKTSYRDKFKHQVRTLFEEG